MQKLKYSQREMNALLNNKLCPKVTFKFLNCDTLLRCKCRFAIVIL